jgi:protein-S-isoprenylcysteine O-methyltransferase
MKYSAVAQVIKILWTILFAYWFVSAFGNKKTKIRQSRESRVVYIVLIFGTWYLLSSHRRSLAFQLIPISAVTQCIGVFLCAAGVSIAIWARRILGRNWSGYVMIKQDHELIQRGPYRYIRHPIYTGLILALAGTVLALIPTEEGFLLVLVWIVAFYIKARHEEHLLTQEFGEQYAEYKRRVKGALIPFVL